MTVQGACPLGPGPEVHCSWPADLWNSQQAILCTASLGSHRQVSLKACGNHGWPRVCHVLSFGAQAHLSHSLCLPRGSLPSDPCTYALTPTLLLPLLRAVLPGLHCEVGRGRYPTVLSGT